MSGLKREGKEGGKKGKKIPRSSHSWMEADCQNVRPVIGLVFSNVNFTEAHPVGSQASPVISEALVDRRCVSHARRSPTGREIRRPHLDGSSPAATASISETKGDGGYADGRVKRL